MPRTRFCQYLSHCVLVTLGNNILLSIYFPRWTTKTWRDWVWERFSACLAIGCLATCLVTCLPSSSQHSKCSWEERGGGCYFFHRDVWTPPSLTYVLLSGHKQGANFLEQLDPVWRVTFCIFKQYSTMQLPICHAWILSLSLMGLIVPTPPRSFLAALGSVSNCVNKQWAN